MPHGKTNLMRNIRPPAPEYITTNKGLNRAERRAAQKSGEMNLALLQELMRSKFRALRKETSE